MNKSENDKIMLLDTDLVTNRSLFCSEIKRKLKQMI